jgi:hypothetical protein
MCRRTEFTWFLTATAEDERRTRLTVLSGNVAGNLLCLLSKSDLICKIAGLLRWPMRRGGLARDLTMQPS